MIEVTKYDECIKNQKEIQMTVLKVLSFLLLHCLKQVVTVTGFIWHVRRNGWGWWEEIRKKRSININIGICPNCNGDLHCLHSIAVGVLLWKYYLSAVGVRKTLEWKRLIFIKKIVEVVVVQCTERKTIQFFKLIISFQSITISTTNKAERYYHSIYIQ